MALNPAIQSIIGNLLQVTGLSGASSLTGIRPWRLEGMLTGSIVPRSSTLNKIKQAYIKGNYQFLRDAGFGTRAANQLKSRGFEESLHWADVLQSSVFTLSETIGVDMDVLLNATRMSKLSAEDLGRYAGMTVQELAEEKGII